MEEVAITLAMDTSAAADTFILGTTATEVIICYCIYCLNTSYLYYMRLISNGDIVAATK